MNTFLDSFFKRQNDLLKKRKFPLLSEHIEHELA